MKWEASRFFLSGYDIKFSVRSGNNMAEGYLNFLKFRNTYPTESI